MYKTHYPAKTKHIVSSTPSWTRLVISVFYLRLNYKHMSVMLYDILFVPLMWFLIKKKSRSYLKQMN